MLSAVRYSQGGNSGRKVEGSSVLFFTSWQALSTRLENSLSKHSTWSATLCSFVEPEWIKQVVILMNYWVAMVT